MAHSHFRPAPWSGAVVIAIAATLAASADLAAQVPSRDVQIAEAVMAAPAEDRGGARVIGWREDGTTLTLREGTNALICLADNPNQDAWNVACYPKSIEPYMARGRELREQGITDSQEVTKRRWDEADAGTLEMPEAPATVYILHGEGFNAATGEVIEPFLRWAIYSPWATAESTGLSLSPGGLGAPWLMFPGTPGAHIMITPSPPGGGI